MIDRKEDKFIKHYEVMYHYGDTGFEENLTGDIFDSKEDAEYACRMSDKHIDSEAYELGDYYFVKEVQA